MLFRAAAVLIGLLPLVTVEAALRLTSWGRPSEVSDPYVGFSGIRPLFVKNRSAGCYELNPARLDIFRPESFAAEKGPDEFRIFCLGGSTVQGRPYAIETSFTTWLELSLQAADPRGTWEVVNCGGISYASYRLVPILREVLRYGPDLVILYTGQNEFLEDRTYESVKQTPAPVRWAHRWLGNLRMYNLLRRGWARLSGGAASAADEPQNELPAEVNALLDYRGGLAQYHRDDAWKAGAVEHYRLNLMRMIRTARQADVPVLLVNPVSNLRDCPPFKVENQEGLTADEQRRFDVLLEQARSDDTGLDARRQIELLEQALAIDERHAGVQFLLGKAYERMGQYDEAKAAYVRAKEEDICPLRMIEPLYEALAQVARQTGTPLVDARQLIEQESDHGIPGNGWLLDHVHPSIDGHQLIADALLERMARLGLADPRGDWEGRRTQLYRMHLAELNASYYVRGRQRLQGLKRWTEGRATKVKRGSAQ